MLVGKHPKPFDHLAGARWLSARRKREKGR